MNKILKTKVSCSLKWNMNQNEELDRLFGISTAWEMNENSKEKWSIPSTQTNMKLYSALCCISSSHIHLNRWLDSNSQLLKNLSSEYSKLPASQYSCSSFLYSSSILSASSCRFKDNVSIGGYCTNRRWLLWTAFNTI